MLRVDKGEMATVAMKEIATEASLTPENASESDLEEQDEFPDDIGYGFSDDFPLSPGGTQFSSPQLRADHLQTLLMKKKSTERYLDRKLKDSNAESSDSLIEQGYLTETTKAKARHERAALQKVEVYLGEMKKFFDLDANTVEIHLKDFCYTAKVDPSQKITTVCDKEGLFSRMSKWMKGHGVTRVEKVDKPILDDINLVLKPSKMYLVLGPPGSGKTTLLKAIAGRLSMNNGETTKGVVTYNGLSLEVKYNVP